MQHFMRHFMRPFMQPFMQPFMRPFIEGRIYRSKPRLPRPVAEFTASA